MRYFKYLLLSLIVLLPVNGFAGPPPALLQSYAQFIGTDRTDEELYAYYDLRDRKTYIQVTNDEDVENPLCIHVQIYQQDQGCSELDFNDELTPNDTVVYDLDNLIRNNGTEVPINLDDNSYGFVTVSAVQCSTNVELVDQSSILSNPLLGNFRIIDDSGYEYRMNMFTDRSNSEGNDTLLEPDDTLSLTPADAVVIIPFNTVEGANQADIIAFITEDNRNLSGIADDNFFGPPNESTPDADDDLIYNEEVGISFSVFLLDENEERLSCDTKTFGCGPNVVLNYGINEDYPNSRGGPLLCEGGGLLPDQKHGYISLENATFLSPLDQATPSTAESFEFVCMVGLNNGNGTGSMDECLYKCVDDNNCSNDTNIF